MAFLFLCSLETIVRWYVQLAICHYAVFFFFYFLFFCNLVLIHQTEWSMLPGCRRVLYLYFLTIVLKELTLQDVGCFALYLCIDSFGRFDLRRGFHRRSFAMSICLWQILIGWRWPCVDDTTLNSNYQLGSFSINKNVFTECLFALVHAFDNVYVCVCVCAWLPPPPNEGRRGRYTKVLSICPDCERHFMNHWICYHKTQYSGTSLWAGVSCEITGVQS